MFEKFGNLYVKVEHIISVGFEFEKDFGQTESGLVVKGGTQKLKSANIVFDNGVHLSVNGDEAKEFHEYWKLINAPVGDVS